MDAPAIIVHDLAQAMAALAAAEDLAMRVVLLSPPETSAAMGPGMFAALAAEASARHPDGFAGALFDCGDEAGLAMAALRRGGMDVLIDLPAPAAGKIRDLARQSGVGAVEKPAAAVLDLADEADAAKAVRSFLEGTTS